MFIDRPSFIQGGVRSQGNVSSAYSSGAAASTSAGRGNSTGGSDILSANTLGALAGALQEMSVSGDQRIEAMRQLYASGQYTVDTGALAGRIADRVLSGRE